MTGEEFFRLGGPLRSIQLMLGKRLHAFGPDADCATRKRLQDQYKAATAAVEEHMREFLRGEQPVGTLERPSR